MEFVNIHDLAARGRVRRGNQSQNVGDRPGGQRNGSKRAGGGGALRSIAGSCGVAGAGAASGTRWKRRGAPGEAGRSLGSIEKSRGVRRPSRPRSCVWPGEAQHSTAIDTTNAVMMGRLSLASRRIATDSNLAALRVQAPIGTDREGWRKPARRDGELTLARGTGVYYRVRRDLLL